MRNTRVVKYYLCSCSTIFRTRKSYVEHLRRTRRWRNYHYAIDAISKVLLRSGNRVFTEEKR